MALAAKCCLCTDEFSSIDDLEAHISADHFNCLPFECEKCKFAKFPTEFAIKRHYEEDHGLVEYFVRYRVSREIYEKKQKVRECLERCVCHSAPSADAGPNSHQGKTTISVEYLHQPHHQYQAHLHESEFLTPSKGRRSAPSPSDLFQSQHRTSVPTSSAELRHHQSELLGGEIGGHEHDSVHAFDQMGTSSLIGNLLEHIKPDMDGNVLSHFDQLYAADLAQAGEGMGAKGIDKIIITSQQQQHPEPDLGTLLAQHKEAQIASIGVGSTGVNVVNTGLIGKPPLSINGPNFSLSHSAENRPKKPPELQCQVCKQMVVNRSTSLMYHVNVKHLKLAIFKCKQCGEEFLWNRPAANRHAKRHGGDESLIENNTERLFPILNRHRREYFNLAYGKSSPIGAQGSGSANILQEQLSGGGGEEEQRMELDEQQQQINGEPKKEADSEDELMSTEAKKTGTMTKAMSTEENHERSGMDKDGQTTPNSILAQLIDMTRSADASSATRQTDVQMPPSSTPGQTPQQQQENPEEGTNKVQKSVKCEGCGDLVINQEWILLNHVNTKHLHLPLYKCVSCDKPFENYLRSYAVRHTKFYHAGDESLLLDQRDQFWAGLRETCSRLFGIGKNAIDGAEHGIDQ